jgi:3'-phosphoadenosine 5'-phosphosulfate sulfotransferase (PAPS reductase)/FAD synthetase
MYISYKDLEIEQKKDLDYKIAEAIKAIKSAFEVCKHRAAIAFSGGKDSTVLWHLIRTHFPEWTERTV